MENSHDGTILLYHGAFETVPFAIKHRFHNVTPDTLYAQLRWLNANFDIVSLDAWLARDDRSGCVAITLDDGYRSALSAVVPLLDTFNMCATVFVNADMLDGGVFWRDMVRGLIAFGREEEFLVWAAELGFNRRQIGVHSFYADTKSKRINSLVIRNLLISFYAHSRSSNEVRFTATRGELLDNTHLRYASHTAHHAVLSSLDKRELEREIVKGLAAVDNLNLKHAGTSRALALPFGSPHDYDERVFGMAAEAGHTAVLLASIGSCSDVKKSGHPIIANRTTAPTTLPGLQLAMAPAP